MAPADNRKGVDCGSVRHDSEVARPAPVARSTRQAAQTFCLCLQGLQASNNKGDYRPVLQVVIGRGPTPVKILFRLRLQNIYPRRMSTTTCKGTDHGLMSKLNIYKNIIKNIYFKILQ